MSLVLLGKVGHGKTMILNKVCATSFESSGGAQSCTRSVQHGTTTKLGLTLLDTPGFYSSDDVAGHIDEQRKALEEKDIGGIYAVVKFGSESEIAEVVNRMMDFVGDDDVRVMLTHVDTVDEAFDRAAYQQSLGKLLDIPPDHIGFFGKDSTGDKIEYYFASTIHASKSISVASEQLSYAVSFSVGARQFYNDIDMIQTGVDKVVQAVHNTRDLPSCDEMDLIRRMMIAEIEEQAKKETDAIEERAKDLTPEERQLVMSRIHDKVNDTVKKLKDDHMPKATTVTTPIKKQSKKSTKKRAKKNKGWNNSSSTYSYGYSYDFGAWGNNSYSQQQRSIKLSDDAEVKKFRTALLPAIIDFCSKREPVVKEATEEKAEEVSDSDSSAESVTGKATSATVTS